MEYRSRGFSLLEVIVATFIFLVIVMISAGYWVTVAKMMQQSRVRMAGVYVAEQVIEKAIEAGYDDVESLAGNGTFQMEATMYGKPYTYTVGYNVTVVQVEPSLKSVKVDISMANSEGFSYETLLSEFL